MQEQANVSIKSFFSMLLMHSRNGNKKLLDFWNFDTGKFFMAHVLVLLDVFTF